MKKNFSALFFSLLLSSLVFAQPTIQWQKCFGGSKGDWATRVIQSNDGGFMVVGQTDSNDGDITGHDSLMDIWIVKCDQNGNLEWQRCLGGGNTENSWSVIQTQDLNYVVAGWSNSTDGDINCNSNGATDCWVIKLDTIGNILWQNCFGGSGIDEIWEIIETSDSGFVFTGRTFSNDGMVSGNHGFTDVWVCKLDKVGNLQWQKCYGGSSSERGNGILQVADGGFVLAGYTVSSDGDVIGFHGGFGDYWILKMDGNGNLIWQKCIGGSDSDRPYRILRTNDMGFLVAGSSLSNDGDASGQHGSGDAWLVKLDSLGNLQWQKMLGGTNNDWFYGIDNTSDGGFIATGYTYSTDGDVSGNHTLDSLDTWLVKLDYQGNIQWQQCLGGSGPDGGVSVQETNDLGFVVAGTSESNDGDVSGMHGSSDFWVVKLASTQNFVEYSNEDLFSFYPNPAKKTITIKVAANSVGEHFFISDMIGNLLLNGELSQMENSVSIDGLSNGMYVVSVGGKKKQLLLIHNDY